MPQYENIRIYPKTKNAVSSLAKKWEMTQVVFLQTAMEYFQKTGVNPKDFKVLSPAEELKKFRDTIISFMRKQEKDYILPVFGKMDALIATFMNYLETEAPRRGGERVDELMVPEADNSKDQEISIKDPNKDLENETIKELRIELERERAKLQSVREQFNTVLESIEVKSTGLQKKPVIELPLGEINSIKEFLKRQ